MRSHHHTWTLQGFPVSEGLSGGLPGGGGHCSLEVEGGSPLTFPFREQPQIRKRLLECRRTSPLTETQTTMQTWSACAFLSSSSSYYT